MPFSDRLGATLHKAIRSIGSGSKRVATTIKRAARTIKCRLQTTDWDRLLRTTRIRITDQLRATLAWIKAHPYLTALLVACGVVAVVVPLAYGSVLGAAGFAAVGPVAGSWAAGTQAAIGSVAAGSVFAVLQSAAMGGYGVALFVAVVPALAAVVAGVVAGVAALLAWL
ncbi:uncharacterized protein J3D65DRAFT_600717 [Phyllosticta citribraziliensis]|uniref:Uncharacterized protein n=1 Tax=Phyllosticta citribraziliensis TaxID=989973 RepID=A0ABR1LZG6_9PEZI